MNFSSITDLFPAGTPPETTYVLLGIAAILAYFLLKKAVKLITFVVIFGGMGLALAALSGQDLSAITGPAMAYATEAFSTIEEKVGSATGGAKESASSSDDEIKKMLSDALRKK